MTIASNETKVSQTAIGHSFGHTFLRVVSLFRASSQAPQRAIGVSSLRVAGVGWVTPVALKFAGPAGTERP